MADYRTMFDYENLRAWDLGDGDITVTIEKVAPGEIETVDEGTKRMPFVWFKGMAKPLGLNKTNGASMAGMYGKDTAKWIGERVTLYTDVTRNKSGAMVDCIRIRPKVPADDQQPDLLAARPGEPQRKKVA